MTMDIESAKQPPAPGAYVIGQITVRDEALWAEYRSRVPETLVPWRGELVFRGKQALALAGQCLHPDVVVIRFPTLGSVNDWYRSPAYQALIPLREQAADMVLLVYET